MIDCKSLVTAQLSAYWGWMVEQGITPEIVANTRDPDIRIPPYLKRSDQVVLNISPRAANRLAFSADGVGFDARFGGKEYNIFIPYSALYGVRGREIPQVALFPMINYRQLSQVINGDESQQVADAVTPPATERPDVDAVTESPAESAEAVKGEQGSVVSVDFRTKKKT